MNSQERNLRLIDCGEPETPPPLIDVAAIADLRARLGDRAADEVLEDAIFEITESLFAIENAVAAGEAAKCERIIRRLGADAASIGLTALAAASQDFAATLASGDSAAEGAARLVSVAEASLTASALVAG
ncbi:MAG: hypothetical protein AAFN79_19660 [Pseudomonadota bacterium]